MSGMALANRPMVLDLELTCLFVEADIAFLGIIAGAGQ
jgi:hypothetical protein